MIRRRLERYPLQVGHKQDWGRGFILLLPHAAVLPESNVGSGVIKPASGFVIQTVRPRAPCGARCIEQAVRTWSAVCLDGFLFLIEAEKPSKSLNRNHFLKISIYNFLVFYFIIILSLSLSF